jgi:hypothetical protein
VILDESLNFDSANCKIVKLPFRKSCGAGKAVLGAVDYFISSVNPFTFNVFKELLVKKYGDYNKIFRKEFYEIV